MYCFGKRHVLKEFREGFPAVEEGEGHIPCREAEDRKGAETGGGGDGSVSLFGLGTTVRIRFGSPFSSEVVVCRRL